MKKLTVLLLITALITSCTAVCLPVGAVAQEEELIYGDLDNSGNLSSADALIALDIASGLKPVEDDIMLEKGDINHDGRITIYDARQILRGSSGLTHLQPSGAFKGLEVKGEFQVANEETVARIFNTVLNKIKTPTDGFAAGFSRKASTVVDSFYLGAIELGGSDIGGTASEIGKAIESSLLEKASEGDGETDVDVSTGSKDYSMMSVENNSYVSNLSASEIYGAKVDFDNINKRLTISIALADTEMDYVTQSAYDKVFNTEIMLEQADTVLSNMVGSSMVQTAMIKEYKNCVLTVVIDCVDVRDVTSWEVASYKTDYYSHAYISEISMRDGSLFAGLIKAKKIDFTKHHTVEYYNFQWQ